MKTPTLKKIAPHCYRRQGILFTALLMTHWAFATEHFFTPPESSFISEPKEQISTLTIPTGSAESAQQLIDSIRLVKSNAVLVIAISGRVVVGSAPLRLGSHMCLVLENRASITAASNATAHSLVQIEGAEFVSVSSPGSERGVLDGQGGALTGITVAGCGKVNIDNLSIRGCEAGAIAYTGRKPGAVNDAGSVTRCLVQDCGRGLSVTGTAGFMCLDNEFHGNRGPAVDVTSPRSVIAGNDFLENATGIVSASSRGVIARNLFKGNDVALQLESVSAGNLITGNRSHDSAGRLLLGGRDNQIFENDLRAETPMELAGATAIFINNAGLPAPTAALAATWFNPPTFLNPHTNPIIIPGLGRYDLTISGSTNRYEPADVAVAQAALRQAHAANPKAVVVLHLQGYFMTRMPTGLELTADTCVILDGANRANLGTALDPVYQRGEPITQVVQLSPAGHCSFSGGTLDGGHQALHGINAARPSVALIENVNIKGAVRDGIRTKGRESVWPLFINGCTLADCGGRGIWLHVAGNVHAIDNTCVGNQQDGIDVDAHAIDCNVLFNTCAGNRRHGIFIEEAATNNLVFGNQALGNNRSGIHVWNEEVAGNTGPNVIAANHCLGNVKGVSVGGRAADRTAGDNLFFNDVCTGNRDWDVVAGNSHATRNFFSQAVLSGGVERHASAYNPVGQFFTTPTLPQ